MQQRLRLISVWVLICAGIVTGIVLLVTSGPAPAHSSNHIGRAPLAMRGASMQSKSSASSVMTIVTTRYGVFGHAATSGDAPPANSPIQGSVARRVGSSGAALPEWALVSGSQLCMDGGADGAFACVDLSNLPADQIFVMGEGSGPSVAPGSPPPSSLPVAQELFGIAPDGVKSVTVDFSNGTSEQAPVVNSGFQMATDGRTRSSYNWTTADGVSHVQNLGS